MKRNVVLVLKEHGPAGERPTHELPVTVHQPQVQGQLVQTRSLFWLEGELQCLWGEGSGVRSWKGCDKFSYIMER